MKALGGDFRTRAARARAAGCDLILHCNGEIAEMEAVAEGAGELGGESRVRVEAAAAKRRAPAPVDRDDALAERERLLEGIVGV
jgi:beta-N-acetylhexosaminidase